VVVVPKLFTGGGGGGGGGDDDDLIIPLPTLFQSHNTRICQGICTVLQYYTQLMHEGR
jgi:hypothetical protein